MNAHELGLLRTDNAETIAGLVARLEALAKAGPTVQSEEILKLLRDTAQELKVNNREYAKLMGIRRR